MSEIKKVTFVSADICQISICFYSPNLKQWYACIMASYDEAGKQLFYVEISRLVEFMDFIGVDEWGHVANRDKIHLVEKGKIRIKSIVKPADNSMGYERFLINSVFIGELPCKFQLSNISAF